MSIRFKGYGLSLHLGTTGMSATVRRPHKSWGWLWVWRGTR